MKILKGNKVFLRALEQSDIEILYNWENDPEIWKVSNTLTPYSRFVLEQYLLNAHLDLFTSKQLRLVICTNEGKAAGCVDLFDYDPYHLRAGIGIMIAPEYRGNGYAREALEVLIHYCFSVLMLNQVFCNISEDNQKSLDLFLGMGFEKTGHKKNWIRTGEKTFENEWFLQLIRK